MKTSTLSLALVLLFTIPDPALAVADETLRSQWLAEAQRLDELQVHYQATAAEQNKSLDALTAARAAVDAALSDPAVGSERLRDLEDKLTAARDQAAHDADDASSLRREIYDQIEQLELLGHRAEGDAPQSLVPETGIAGMWRAVWDKSGDFGVVKLEASGNLVTGTYRLTNGNAGSVHGTFAGDELQLEVVNSVHGPAGTVTAKMDGSGRHLEGVFLRLDLASNQRSSGDIHLTHLDPATANGMIEKMR